MDIRTHANAVNVAGSVTVRDQNVTVKKTADVQKWKNSHNVNHQTFNNYQCVSATSTAAHDPALNKFFRSLTRFFESSPQYEQDHGDDSPLSEGRANRPSLVLVDTNHLKRYSKQARQPRDRRLDIVEHWGCLICH